ncbi:hypothetical protein KIL84_012285 [Mauremys mutica]|uniref:Uncharacterized protein n=1 Tax=Mauremys mutica TaxID=74926 RepID=A0A9D3XFU3_9SAUR|nr:hypothetical protein KIL84_012285 [Mauremys mutica]
MRSVFGRTRPPRREALPAHPRLPSQGRALLSPQQQLQEETKSGIGQREERLTEFALQGPEVACDLLAAPKHEPL